MLALNRQTMTQRAKDSQLYVLSFLNSKGLNLGSHPAYKRLRQEDCYKFKASLCNRMVSDERGLQYKTLSKKQQQKPRFS